MADAKKKTRRVARFFHASPLSTDSELQLDKSASHHLLTVLRAKAGDAITVFNGNGFDYHAVLMSNNQRGASRQARLQIGESTFRQTESPLSIQLVQSVSRSDRMEITIRQAVEFGVSHIQPLLSRHSGHWTDEKRADKKQSHWQNVVTSAAEQSGRAVLPTLSGIQTFKAFFEQDSGTTPAGSSDCKLVLSPTANTSICQHLDNRKQQPDPIRSVSVLIGPESGLDADEIHMAESAGFYPVHIGPRIMRTESAGPACIVLLQALLGDLQVK